MEPPLIESPEEKKPVIEEPVKSSMEILSELFSTFDAEPPLIIKKEKTDEKHKKSKKKKHKHKEKKDKKHKKKDKKRKRSSSDASEIDLANLLIKEERKSPEKKIKLEVTDDGIPKIKKEPKDKADKIKSDDIKNEPNTTKPEVKSDKDKIVIKNLKFSSIFEATIEQVKRKDVEDGELMESDASVSSGDLKKTKKHKHHKHTKHDDTKKKKKCPHRSRSKDREKSKGDDKDHKKHKSRERSRSRDRSVKSLDRSYYNDTEHKKYKSFWDRDEKYKDKYLSDDYKERDSDDFYKSRRHKESYYSKDDDFYKSRDSHKEEKWFMKDRYRGYNSDRERKRKDKERSTSRDDPSYIDKKKLLEIARKNAIQMMKSGSLPGALTLGPQAQEKVIAAIKAGGKTIEELTDFCKALSKKEEAGDLSSVSDANSDSDSERPFHHPFQIKDRPTSITMNIKNSIPLPIKSTQERTTELRMQFPVSSGQQHRRTESEWVPVPPKKVEKSVPAVTVADVPVVTAPPLPIKPTPSIPTSTPTPENPLPGPQVFPDSPTDQQAVNIGKIVSQRLTAMRKLQENPLDVQAITQMYKAQKEMQTWAESKQQPGQFTGSTGAQILSQAELSSGYQAWARKDQLQNAAPVSGGMGMHLLQKMGWRPGEGLGKEKTGTLEPLLLEVKLDKKGLVANEEQKKKQAKQQNKVTVKSPQGKHPVSLLGEYASKCKLGAPQYSLCFECGPDHKKNFLFQVILNGIVYKPNIASPNKKDAKANAAVVCLQALGLLP